MQGVRVEMELDSEIEAAGWKRSISGSEGEFGSSQVVRARAEREPSVDPREGGRRSVDREVAA